MSQFGSLFAEISTLLSISGVGGCGMRTFFFVVGQANEKKKNPSFGHFGSVLDVPRPV